MSKIPCGGFNIDDKTLRFKNNTLKVIMQGVPEGISEEFSLTKGDNTAVFDGNGIEVENNGTDIVTFGVGNFEEGGVLSAHPGVLSSSSLHINASNLFLHKTPIVLESPNGTAFKITVSNDGMLQVVKF